MNIDLKSFTEHVAQRVKSMLDPFERRLRELEERQPQKGERGDKGDPGESPVVIIDDVVDNLMTDAEFKSMISGAVAQQYAEHPPAAGADGKDGEKGPPGESPAVIIDDVVDALMADAEFKSMFADAVAKQYAANPPASGADGKDGEKGADGSDGVGVAGGMIDKSGNLILTTSNGETHNLGRVEGKDGLGFEDASATWDKEAQEIVMRYARGDVFKEVRYPAPAPVHAGFWQAGMQVKCGAFATHNGSLWYAMRTTSEEPTYQSKDWQLAARKGADGQHKAVKVDRD